MDPTHLQDRISLGLGAAARKLGGNHDAYRPSGPNDPLAVSNRYLRLPAWFNAQDPSGARPNTYGRPLWYGVFDAAYTRSGDYLSGPSGTFFIAAQQSLLPVLCVQTNRVISASRPAAPRMAGVNAYGGLHRTATQPLLSNWPASVLAAGGGGDTDAALPADGRNTQWSVLLPPTPVALRASDLLTDDLGRTYVIAAPELTDLGWRILARQANT
jgi:hypothetical protein